MAASPIGGRQTRAAVELGPGNEAFVDDERADRRAVAEAPVRTGEQAEVQEPAGLLPGTELADCRVLAHVFARGALERELPVVDDPRPVRGEVRQPPVPDQAMSTGPGRS
jgi:hypothetical protein